MSEIPNAVPEEFGEIEPGEFGGKVPFTRAKQLGSVVVTLVFLGFIAAIFWALLFHDSHALGDMHIRVVAAREAPVRCPVNGVLIGPARPPGYTYTAGDVIGIVSNAVFSAERVSLLSSVRQLERSQLETLHKLENASARRHQLEEIFLQNADTLRRQRVLLAASLARDAERTLYAPCDGSLLKGFSGRQIVKAGEAILSLVPATAGLQVELQGQQELILKLINKGHISLQFTTVDSRPFVTEAQILPESFRGFQRQHPRTRSYEAWASVVCATKTPLEDRVGLGQHGQLVHHARHDAAVAAPREEEGAWSPEPTREASPEEQPPQTIVGLVVPAEVREIRSPSSGVMRSTIAPHERARQGKQIAAVNVPGFDGEVQAAFEAAERARRAWSASQHRLEIQQRTHETYKALHAHNAISLVGYLASLQTLQDAQANLAQAEAQYRVQSRKALSLEERKMATLVLAPISGWVGAWYVTSSDFVQEGDVLGYIASSERKVIAIVQLSALLQNVRFFTETKDGEEVELTYLGPPTTCPDGSTAFHLTPRPSEEFKFGDTVELRYESPSAAEKP